MDLFRIGPFAAEHHGLITKAAAIELGVSKSAWYRAIDAHVLEELAHGVCRLAGAPPSREQRVLAAVWSAGPGSLATHRTAAWLWGIRRPDSDPIDVSMSSRRRKYSPAGVVVHRPRDMVDLKPIVRRGIPTTDPVRMLLDLGAVAPRSVANALEVLVAARVASPAAFRAGAERHSRQGRHGVVALRDALDTRSLGELPSDSVLEARFADLARRFRLPPMEFHAVVEGFEVDFRVLDSVVVVECDGHESHGLNRDQF